MFPPITSIYIYTYIKTYNFCHPKICKLDNAWFINQQVCTFDIPKEPYQPFNQTSYSNANQTLLARN